MQRVPSVHPAKGTSPLSWQPLRWTVLLYCLLIAAGCLLLCSKSSPLYPINDWADANIYFSSGKAMLHGRVMYRDVYDHKGPLLYAVHAFCALISPLSFFGVWLLEVACFTAFLVSVYQYLRLLGAKKGLITALPLAAALVAASFTFAHGDSAEELCLPLLSFSFLWLMRYVRQEAPAPMPVKTALLSGVFCGCVLWVKFTMLGLHMGFIGVAFLMQARQRQWKAAWRTLLAYGLGMTIATLPWLLYFGLHGALYDWLKTYFYDNLFLYTGNEAASLLGRVKAMGMAAFQWVAENPVAAGTLLLGLLWGTFRKDRKPWERLALWGCTGLTALGAFVGGKTYPYYGLILLAFVGTGFAPLCGWSEKIPGRPESGRRRIQTAIGVGLLALALCWGFSINTKTSFLQPKESTMQYQLAQVVNQTPGATLLNYGFMDAGFFTATGIAPTVKYFHQTNVPLREMLEEQQRYVKEGLCTYVVARGNEPASILENYELVKTADSPGFWYEHVYLYRLREGEP